MKLSIFSASKKNLDKKWTNTKAVKGESFFEIVSDVEGSLPHKVPFDDEAQSILSLNLWENWMVSSLAINSQ